jgi:hypothetical protein
LVFYLKNGAPGSHGKDDLEPVKGFALPQGKALAGKKISDRPAIFCPGILGLTAERVQIDVLLALLTKT